MKLVEDRQTDRPTDRPTDRLTDRQTDIATYRAAIAAKKFFTYLSSHQNSLVSTFSFRI